MSNNYITKEMKNRIFSVMRDKNVTSSDLCRTLNVAYPAFQATFDGKCPCYGSWQKKIAEALNVDKNELFKEFSQHKIPANAPIPNQMVAILNARGYSDEDILENLDKIRACLSERQPAN